MPFFSHRQKYWFYRDAAHILSLNCTYKLILLNFFSIQVWQPKSPDISYEFRERTMWIWITKVRIIGIKRIFSLINVCQPSITLFEQSLRPPGPEVIKLFSCSTQLRLKFILLINVKMPTIVGILTFISWINYWL